MWAFLVCCFICFSLKLQLDFFCLEMAFFSYLSYLLQLPFSNYINIYIFSQNFASIINYTYFIVDFSFWLLFTDLSLCFAGFNSFLNKFQQSRSLF